MQYLDSGYDVYLPFKTQKSNSLFSRAIVVKTHTALRSILVKLSLIRHLWKKKGHPWNLLTLWFYNVIKTRRKLMDNITLAWWQLEIVLQGNHFIDKTCCKQQDSSVKFFNSTRWNWKAAQNELREPFFSLLSSSTEGQLLRIVNRGDFDRWVHFDRKSR